MTGPEHYREAERLLEHDCDQRCYAGHRAILRQDAMVHVMLALAAATALNDAEGGMPGPDHVAWLDVAAVTRPEDAEVAR